MSERAANEDDLAMRLGLYEATVQHPEAEVALLLRMYAHHQRGGLRAATRLREDFAGSAALAGAFAAMNENHRALAVEIDPATAGYSRQRFAQAQPSRAEDLVVYAGDVLEIATPRVDVVAALNFSTLIYHTRAELGRYFRHARRCLRRGGVFAMDLFGGPGAQRTGKQTREVEVISMEADGGAGPGAISTVGYTWEQRAFDAVSRRIDCRIHFELEAGRTLPDAFVYDWRLWTLPDVTGLLTEAGFKEVTVWCDGYDAARGESDGAYEPRAEMEAREDWIAYVTGRR